MFHVYCPTYSGTRSSTTPKLWSTSISLAAFKCFYNSSQQCSLDVGQNHRVWVRNGQTITSIQPLPLLLTTAVWESDRCKSLLLQKLHIFRPNQMSWIYPMGHRLPTPDIQGFLRYPRFWQVFFYLSASVPDYWLCKDATFCHMPRIHSHPKGLTENGMTV